MTSISDRLANLPGIGLIFSAVRGYIRHQSASLAGSIAFSTVLSMFPLLILLSAAAAYVGEPGDAASLVERVIDFAPPLVQQSLEPVIEQVLRQRNQALVAIGLLITLWTASSGLQAIRTALNRAYEVERSLPFWRARIKVTLFTIIVGLGTLAAFSSVIFVPYLRDLMGSGDDVRWMHFGVRYAGAFVVVATVYALLYAWLPDRSQRLITVLPGALCGGLLWVAAAATLSYTLRNAGKLALIYGSFAGVVATLVFLYVSAATLIFGAEFNAVAGRSASSKAPQGDGGRPVRTA